MVEGQRLPLTYHHAAFQVLDEGDHSRLVWLTDVLPHAMADAVRARVERGIVEMKEVLEPYRRQIRMPATQVDGPRSLTREFGFGNGLADQGWR